MSDVWVKLSPDTLQLVLQLRSIVAQPLVVPPPDRPLERCDRFERVWGPPPAHGHGGGGGGAHGAHGASLGVHSGAGGGGPRGLHKDGGSGRWVFKSTGQVRGMGQGV
jgi:vacuolar protein sorting-associated protein 13A/C